MSFSTITAFRLLWVIGNIVFAFGVIGLIFSSTSGNMICPLILIITGGLMVWYGRLHSHPR